MTNGTKKTTKSMYKRTYDRLKKMTIITIVICVILFIATPILMFVNSKYKVIQRNEISETRSEKNPEGRTEGQTVSDIF